MDEEDEDIFTNGIKSSPSLPNLLRFQLSALELDHAGDGDISQMVHLNDQYVDLNDGREAQRRNTTGIGSRKNSASSLNKELTFGIASSGLGNDFQRKSRELSAFDVKGYAQHWILSFVVVTFDIEIGPAIECVYPDVNLTKEEKTTICFSAFPDSNSWILGDSCFSFRFRSNSRNLSLTPPEFKHLGDFTYGFVSFRQQRDKTSRRGYFQKSVVALSLLPYPGLLNRLIQIVGPVYFEKGRFAFEHACRDLSSWPSPTFGMSFKVPLLFRTLEIDIPSINEPLFIETSSFSQLPALTNDHILGSFIDGSLYNSFKSILKELWTLWELVLIGEPIVVFAQSPIVCSQAVYALVDIISPIPFGGDFRPYFTIQDSDYSAFCSKNRTPSCVILGVTNPFFIRALDHWPHILRIGQSNQRSHSPAGLKNSMSRKISVDLSQGLYTKYKPCVKCEKNIIKEIEGLKFDGSNSAMQLNNYLRRYFNNLTERFLAPLNRYYYSLLPVERNGNASPMNTLERKQFIKPFSKDDFLKTLTDRGPHISFKVYDWTSLYKKFLNSAQFPMWLHKRNKAAELKAQKVYWSSLLKQDYLDNLFKSNRHIELMNILLFLKSELISKELFLDAEMVEYRKVLASQINDLLEKAPASMKGKLTDFLNTLE